LRVEAESVVLVQQPVPMPAETIPLSALDDYAEELDEHYDLLAPTPYVPHSPGLLEMVTLAGQESDGTAGGYARAASLLVHGRFRYEKGATHVHSSIHDAMATGAGVCQDFAHLLLALVRVRPALDDEGSEHIKETSAEPVRVPSPEDLPQQQQQ